MKLAIDSYCYHRYFGEVYPGLQKRPGAAMTVWDFLARARKHRVQGVSIEACFLRRCGAGLLDRLRDELDAAGLERVWAWGHPDGLRSGTDRTAARDLVRHLGYARRIGARVMRIVGGSRRTRPASWAVHKRRLAGMLARIVPAAEDQGVVMALENHIDLRGDEILDLVTTIDSPWLGICLDTGNNLRMLEDPAAVARALAPWARATHIKDIGVLGGDPREFSFWPSVPLGDGLIDLAGVIAELKRVRYDGLLAVEVDFLHPRYGDEDRAVGKSLRYLRELLKA